jgi:hypothetical protein
MTSSQEIRSKGWQADYGKLTRTVSTLAAEVRQLREEQAALEAALAFEADEDASFELTCPDCGCFVYFTAGRPRPGEPGFYSDLTLGAVVEAVKGHKCEDAWADD